MNDSKNVIGVGIAKRVFQVCEVDKATGEMKSMQLQREKFLEYFANRSVCLIGMEACGSSQHWARKLIALGHTVKLLQARQVKAFVCGNKNDVADAKAIWLAVQQPGVKAVAIKSEAQQAVLAMHRMRQQLVKFRTAQINALRGLLTEYREVMPQGRHGIVKRLPEVLGQLADRLPALLIDTLREQFARIGKLDEEVAEIERRLRDWHRRDDVCQRIAEIPGVGMLTATAVVATMGDANAFKSGREFATWLGLVSRQTGTGGRVKLLGISKRGDTYVRTLLIHGARCVLANSKSPPEWTSNLARRRPLNVAVVALANKMARTLWALLAHERRYQCGYVSQPA
ncbi:MAG: IS110 family transposase [Rhodanobacter sp.]|jgi:transposase|nr:IS110 family transposase [Rhodanobacter sp.]